MRNLSGRDTPPLLAAIGLDERVWRYMRYGNIRTPSQMRAWILDLLALQRAGADLPFAVIHLPSGNPAGVTRYIDINTADRSLEIGGAWYGLDYQGAQINPESKYLLPGHAFETLGCIRVQFKTHQRNARSTRAIEKLGAVKEGLLRNHMILPDGAIRHSLIYSITDSEWPAVKSRLETRLYSPHLPLTLFTCASFRSQRKTPLKRLASIPPAWRGWFLRTGHAFILWIRK
ncbi:MAG: GNAT family protein [Anaerolineales bacterium]|nr:GNAT family protein [Anaerolineales bacterium]